MPDINVNKLSEALNTKADIDLNNTGVFSTSGGGGVNLTSSTPVNASGKEVTSADFFQSNLLNYTTNRILEIPQDIKLEINNGNLTLKAGSKLRKLTGEEWITKNDFSLNTSYYGFNQPCLIIPGSTDNGSSLTNLETPNINICSSGTTIPTSTTSQYHWFFKTDTKEYYWTHDNGATWERRAFAEFFPIAIANVGAEKWTSIEQVFNGFGYIGRTVFLLPGVKFQTSQGKNIDGSIKTAIYTRKTVLINSLTTHTGHYYLMANGSAGYPFFIPKSQRFIQSYAPDTSNLVGINYWYNTSEERWYGLTDDKTWNYMPGVMDIFGEVSATDGLLYDFKGYPLNHINTYQRTELAGMCMPSNKYIDLTLGASGTRYIAPANGWFSLDTWTTSTTSAYYQLHNRTSDLALLVVPDQGHVYQQKGFIPCKAGDIVAFTYSNIDTTKTRWRFIYAQGEQ